MQGGGFSRCHLLEEEIISPQTLVLLQVLFLHRTSPEVSDLLAVVLFHLFDIFKDGLDCLLCGRTHCAITTLDISIWDVSRVLTLYQTSAFLVSQLFTFQQVHTFWEFK